MGLRRRITLSVGLVAAVALIIGSVLVLGLDARVLSDQLAARLSAQLGREVTVSGDTGIEPGWTPTLTLRDLAVAAPPGEAGPPSATVGMLSATLSLTEALRGRVVVHALEATDAAVYLRDADVALLASAGNPGGGSVTLESVRLARVEGVIARSTRDFPFGIDEAVVTPGEFIEGSLTGTLDGGAVSGEFSVDPAADGQLLVNWEGGIADVSVRARGMVAPGSPAPVALDIEVDSPGERPDLTGRLGFEDGAWHLRNARGQAGGVPFGAELMLTLGAVPRLTGAVTLERFVPGAAAATTPLPAWRDRVEIDLRVRVGEVAYEPLPLSNVRARLGLLGPRVTLEDIQATAADGRVSGTVQHQRGEVPETTLDLTATRLDIHQVPLLARVAEDLTGRLDARASLTFTGADAARVRRSATGTVRLALDDARARARTLETAVGGIHTLVDTLISGETEWVELDCAVADYALADGVATSRVLVLDSEFAQVVGTGTIGLADGALDLHLVPRAKSVTLNLAVPVNVTGTLDAPQFAADPTGATRRVAGLLAGTFVFPPALIAAFADLGVADAGCLAASSPATGDAAEQLAREAGAAAERVGEALGEAGEALSRSAGEAEQAVREAAGATERALQEMNREAERAAREVGRTLEQLFGN